MTSFRGVRTSGKSVLKLSLLGLVWVCCFGDVSANAVESTTSVGSASVPSDTRLRGSGPEGQKPPRVEYLWIAPNGQIEKGLWKRQGTWLWQESAEFPGFYRPLLRTWLQIPLGTELIDFQSDEMVIRRDIEGGPFSGAPGSQSGRSLVVETERVRATALATLRDSQGRSRQVGFVIRMIQDQPMTWTHSSCQSLGLNLQLIRPAAQDFLVSSAYCKDSVDQVEVLLSGSADSRISQIAAYSNNKRELLSEEDEAPQPLRSRKVIIQKSEFKGVAQATLFDWELGSDEDSEQKSASDLRQYALVLTRKLDPQIRSTGFYFGSGLNFSFLGYQEDPGTEGELIVNQTALTLKVATGFRLQSGKWDFGMSTFLNLVPMFPSYEGSDEIVGELKVPSRFYGINGRVSYRLTSEFSPWEWRVALGPYFWGMIVPNQVYGVKMLFGPQLFASLRNFQRKDRNWGVYAKIAMTGEGGSFSTQNYEAAIGADYQLGRWGRFPISLTFDTARVTFAPASVEKSMILQSYSLGVQTSM